MRKLGSPGLEAGDKARLQPELSPLSPRRKSTGFIRMNWAWRRRNPEDLRCLFEFRYLPGQMSCKNQKIVDAARHESLELGIVEPPGASASRATAYHFSYLAFSSRAFPVLCTGLGFFPFCADFSQLLLERMKLKTAQSAVVYRAYIAA